MAWRVHLTNQAIQSLQILPGKPPSLAVWTRRDRVSFYDIESGALLLERTIPRPPDAEHLSDRWQEFVGALTGPNEKAYLPHIRFGQTNVYATDDGKLRVYHVGNAELLLETDGKEVPLTVKDATNFIAMDLDRALGILAALDENGKLHIYQQNIRVGAFDIGLVLQDIRPSVVISKGGGNVFVTDGRQLLCCDTGGAVEKRLPLHYYVSRLTCSPGGGMVATSDLESGVVRVYRGDDLTLTHQRFAVDLVASATQVQLMADLPPTSVAVSALAASNRGVIAFAMAGVVCVTDISHMDELPRPQALL